MIAVIVPGASFRRSFGDSDRGNIPPPFLRRVNGGRTVEVGLA